MICNGIKVLQNASPISMAEALLLFPIFFMFPSIVVASPAAFAQTFAFFDVRYAANNTISDFEGSVSLNYAQDTGVSGTLLLEFPLASNEIHVSMYQTQTPGESVALKKRACGFGYCFTAPLGAASLVYQVDITDTEYSSGSGFPVIFDFIPDVRFEANDLDWLDWAYNRAFVPAFSSTVGLIAAELGGIDHQVAQRQALIAFVDFGASFLRGSPFTDPHYGLQATNALQKFMVANSELDGNPSWVSSLTSHSLDALLAGVSKNPVSIAQTVVSNFASAAIYAQGVFHVWQVDRKLDSVLLVRYILEEQIAQGYAQRYSDAEVLARAAHHAAQSLEECSFFNTIFLACGLNYNSDDLLNQYQTAREMMEGWIETTKNARLSQEIYSFEYPAALTAGSSANIAASASSGLPVTLYSETPATCSINFSTVHGISPGACTIKATQAGDGTWLAAEPMIRSFDILPETGPTNRCPVSSLSASASSVRVGSTVTFNGTNSYDPDGHPLTYNWTLIQPSGSNANLSGTSTIRSLTPSVGGDYTVRLTVSDGFCTSEPAVQTVYVDASETFDDEDAWITANRIVGPGLCGQVIQLGQVTLQENEYWDSPRLWARAENLSDEYPFPLYIMLGLNNPPDVDEVAAADLCSRFGAVSSNRFYADFLMDMMDGSFSERRSTHGQTWYRSFSPGDRIYIAFGIPENIQYHVHDVTLQKNGYYQVPVPASCGSAAGTLTSSPPSTNQCGSGSVASGSETSGAQYTWTCGSSTGGASASCLAPRGYSVTVVSQGEGSVSPSETQVVEYQGTVPITIQPAHGFEAGVNGCGINQSAIAESSTFNTTPVIANCAVNVTFSRVAPAECGSANEHPVHASPAGQLCSGGSSPSAIGFRPDRFVWDCLSDKGGATAVCQAPRLFNINVALGPNGTLSPDTGSLVGYLDIKDFFLSPDPGYKGFVQGCGIIQNEITAARSLAVGPITGDCALEVSFSEIVDSQQRDALIALYNTTNGSNWIRADGWLGEPGTECDWYGVSCSAGALRGLHLGRNSLTGYIPAELGQLATLEDLDLNWNEISGNIPAELGQLVKLESIDFSSNQISGIIPEAVGQLLELERLNLSFNKLTGSIPPELGQLKNLSQLHLAGNQLSGPIPAALGQLSNLESLQLFWNELNGVIPPELGQLTRLEDLRLFENRLSGTIPGALGQLANLVSLDLHANEFIGSIPAELSGASALRTINLGGNQLSGNIPGWLGGMEIQELWLHDNQFFGGIPSEIGQMSELESLLLRNNQLYGEIPKALGQIGTLVSLDLGGNELSGTIPEELAELERLQHFDLQNNNLDGSIPVALGQLSNLRSLNLQGNNLTGRIPTELGQLRDLGSLNLSQNYLSGGVPVELGDLDLWALSLQHNDLTGGIPSELGGVGNLQFLSLNDNRLSGGIPAEIGGLSNLQFLNLQNNRLMGQIPPELGQLMNLFGLRLAANYLSGEVPPALSQLQQLWFLTLRFNCLRATDPELHVFLASFDPQWQEFQDECQVELNADAPLTDLWGQAGSEQTFVLTVPEGVGMLTIRTSGGAPAGELTVRSTIPMTSVGDVNLWVRFGALPNDTEHDCWRSGSGVDKSCTIANPAAGTYFITLEGVTAYSGVTLEAEFGDNHGVSCGPNDDHALTAGPQPGATMQVAGCRSISVESGVLVPETSSLQLIARERIVFQPGVRVALGGHLSARVDSTYASLAAPALISERDSTGSETASGGSAESARWRTPEGDDARRRGGPAATTAPQPAGTPLATGDGEVADSQEHAPPTPLGFTATPGDGSVALRWETVPEADGFHVYWSRSAGIHPFTAASYDGFVGNVRDARMIVGELENDTEYFFVVTATRDGRESAASIEVAAIPEAGPVLVAGRYRLEALDAPTVVDLETGLEWQRCALGQQWDGAGCAGSAGAFSHAGAQQATAALNRSRSEGEPAWRVPAIEELQGLVYCTSGMPAHFPDGLETGCWGSHGIPTLEPTVFPTGSAAGGWFWSSSTYTDGQAWGLDFDRGTAHPYHASAFSGVRVVRPASLQSGD